MLEVHACSTFATGSRKFPAREIQMVSRVENQPVRCPTCEQWHLSTVDRFGMHLWISNEIVVALVMIIAENMKVSKKKIWHRRQGSASILAAVRSGTAKENITLRWLQGKTVSHRCVAGQVDHKSLYKGYIHPECAGYPERRNGKELGCLSKFHHCILLW